MHRSGRASATGLARFPVERESKIDLAIVDFAMPGMNGADVARLAQTKRPTLPVLFVTGFADRTALAGISEANIISKPFVGDELAYKVRHSLATCSSGNVVRLRR